MFYKNNNLKIDVKRSKMDSSRYIGKLQKLLTRFVLKILLILTCISEDKTNLPFGLSKFLNASLSLLMYISER